MLRRGPSVLGGVRGFWRDSGFWRHLGIWRYPRLLEGFHGVLEEYIIVGGSLKCFGVFHGFEEFPEFWKDPNCFHTVHNSLKNNSSSETKRRGTP